MQHAICSTLVDCVRPAAIAACARARCSCTEPRRRRAHGRPPLPPHRRPGRPWEKKRADYQKPLVGILAQACHYCPGRSYVAAGFAKWIEAAGARAVPIRCARRAGLEPEQRRRRSARPLLRARRRATCLPATPAANPCCAVR